MERIDIQHVMKELTLKEKASLLSGANFWNSKAIERLNIPSIMLTDGPHGLRKQGGKADHLGLNKSIPATCFPPAATLANSWDQTILYKVGEALGKEGAYENVGVVLGPGMNIKRNPLSGRNFEYFSEDPYLSGSLSASMIKGMQSQGIAACAKHYAVNSQEFHRMSVDEIVDERALHELYLESFRIAVEDGEVDSIMTSYNKVNGTYANENTHLLVDILRNQWNFKGLVVTDWGGNNDRVLGLKAGNHLEMPSTNGMTDQDIVDAIHHGTLEESMLNDRVEEYLNFLNHLIDKKVEGVQVDMDAQHQIARQAAQASIVLLKNDHQILPLKKDTRYGLVGDFMVNPRYQGAGSSLINPTRCDNLYDTLMASDYTIAGYAQGFHRYGKTDPRLVREAVNLSKMVDTVLVFLGLDESSEAEGVDRQHMKLQQNQLDCIQAIVETGKPVIVILAGGSPVELPFMEALDGCIHGYLPGQAGGLALFDVLSGAVNPSGKLAETYPIKYEDVASSAYFPGHQNTSEHREGIFIGYRYFDTVQENVLFPFGYGLSYTQFHYESMTLNPDGVTVTLENTGEVAGSEVVQVYVHKCDSTILRPKQELAGYAKVHLEAHEKTTITIPYRDHAFSFYNVNKGCWDSEKGQYEIMVGASSRDIRLTQSIDRDGNVDIEDIYTPMQYQNLELKNITQASFQSLLDFKLPESEWDPKKTLELNDIIEQARTKSVFGRFVNWLIDMLYKFFMWRGNPIAANNVRFAQNLPFRGIARMSAGRVNMKALDGLMDMFNGHFFKGLFRFVKNYLFN
ncbi:beta-glucosidase [Erysipelothrix larvae]|uniref:beta-glucosidase n=1 Tax=Erysipelothrix larvae TaxID=1514105 RepID=UPI0018E0A0D8|nr:glycoside hydrolase family 3 C-terminal domain-containing protein [Erysipelothrix larvae]